MSEEIGPSLPPGFGTSKKDERVAKTIGPALPPGFMPSNADASGEEDDDCYGPTLPPAIENSTSQQEEDVHDAKTSPAPEEVSSDSDGDIIGPSLDLAAPANAEYDAAAEFSARYESLEAEQKRIEKEKLLKQAGREEWMTSLPTVGLPQDLGLTARSFRVKAPNEQDKSWTQTPQERQKSAAEEKVNKKRDLKVAEASCRDEEISKKLKKYNDQNRKDSLLDLHQKKLKKEKKKSKGEKEERVPFSRETDLQVNKFDEAQRKSVLKKAALLDTRFGHGSQKYE